MSACITLESAERDLLIEHASCRSARSARSASAAPNATIERDGDGKADETADDDEPGAAADVAAVVRGGVAGGGAPTCAAAISCDRSEAFAAESCRSEPAKSTKLSCDVRTHCGPPPVRVTRCSRRMNTACERDEAEFMRVEATALRLLPVVSAFSASAAVRSRTSLSPSTNVPRGSGASRTRREEEDDEDDGESGARRSVMCSLWISRWLHVQ